MEFSTFLLRFINISIYRYLFLHSNFTGLIADPNTCPRTKSGRVRAAPRTNPRAKTTNDTDKRCYQFPVLFQNRNSAIVVDVSF